MTGGEKMSPQELRASLGLSSIFGLRMLGMFVILPVFAIYAEHLPGGDNLTLVGIAVGAYGLTQAILQIPFGWISDRCGRKPVIYWGLVLFAAGSFLAALGSHIYVVIAGRMIQGAGAIAGVVVAMIADLTREEQRTKAMAMIGSTIGLTFALSLVASPWFNQLMGVPGIFAMTGVLALAAIFVVRSVVPDVPERPHPPERRADASLWQVAADRELLRLNYGIFVLHAALMALFIVVPFALRDAGLAVDGHWKVYLPVMLGSFVLMLPAIFYAGRHGRVKRVFVASIALIAASQVMMPWMLGSVARTVVLLLVFFTAFNVLEAALPSLISRLAPVGAKGAALGVFSSVQFFGTFVGAAAGGFLYGRWGVLAIVIFILALIVIWVVAALGMKVPVSLATRVYAIPSLDRRRADGLSAQLEALPGVHEALVIAGERMAYLKVDSAGFDEENVLKLIEGEI